MCTVNNASKSYKFGSCLTTHCPLPRYNGTHGGRGLSSGTTALSIELGRHPVTYAAAALAPLAALS